MPSRRRALHAGGSLLAVALAGCLDSTPATPDGSSPSDSPSTDGPQTDRPTPDSGAPRLTTTVVEAGAVPDDATVALLDLKLLETVREAATTDGRVMFAPDGGPDYDETLVLGRFDAVRFREQTYDPLAEFVPFAGEVSYYYSVDEVPASEVAGESDDEILDYADLTADERAIADTMLAGDSYDVGLHEDVPPALDAFDAHSYLRTEDGAYAVRRIHGDGMVHHDLTLTPEPPEPGDAVVTVADEAVPAGLRDVVRRAVADLSVAVDSDERDALADFLEGVGYVATAGTVAAVEFGGADDDGG